MESNFLGGQIGDITTRRWQKANGASARANTNFLGVLRGDPVKFENKSNTTLFRYSFFAT